MEPQFTNELIQESSPYLLQHVHNPIHWRAWNDTTLEFAKKESKLIVISIGYAACHWCHVMEHESFEDLEVAKIMNDNFVSIKVDREERPDVDQVYMSALQLMTGAGGWPLNIVALPDGRPIWGGTYFKKEQWMSALGQISNLYNSKPDTLLEYADKLENGLKQLDFVQINAEEANFSIEVIADAVKNWSKQFDHVYGGTTRAPKFMMPNNYHFLLRFAQQTNNHELKNYVNHTLTKMAYGGVYDHVGGGFSRYSIDDRWHVPHFEKMLYDNAQMVSLYADAYLISKDELYRNVIVETLGFVERELTGPEGNFYSSLDADSLTNEGILEEGAYYVWTQNELKSLLKEDYELFSDYYNVNPYGHWEHDNYVLIRNDDDQSFSKKHSITLEILSKKKNAWKKTLLKERNKRERPRLDDKSLTSWNALMLKGYVDAYLVLNDKKHLETVIKNAKFIVEKLLKPDGGLNHSYKNGVSTINGFLEDYAATISAFLALHEQTFNVEWLRHARDLCNYTIDHFFDDESKMFFFTSKLDPKLVSRSIEYIDNVIPSSNSIMAKNLFILSHHFENKRFLEIATTMLNNVKPQIETHPHGFSNWCDLMLNYVNPFYEVAILGENALEKNFELNTFYAPNKIVTGSKKEEDLPLLKNRYVPNETLIYICENKACYLPVLEVKDALKQLKNQS